METSATSTEDIPKPRNTRSRTFLLLFIVVSISILGVASLQKKSQKDPCPPSCNVILVSIDSLGAKWVGAYGATSGATPHLDAWAKRGVQFSTYITPAYLTPISEMTLHTSLHPRQSGVTRFDSRLDRKFLTLAQVLDAEGYRTTAMGSSPEFFFSADSIAQSFARGFDEYYESYYENYTEKNWGEYDDLRVLPTEALSFVAQPPKEKFFLWLTLGTAHWPYGRFDFPTKDSYEGWLKDGSLVYWWTHLQKIYKGMVWSVKHPGTIERSLSDADRIFLNEGYESNIRVTDAFLGDFFSNLEKSGLLETTIVIVHSEHGEDMGEHGYYSHHDIFDTTVHTPLLVYIPGQPHKIIDGLISSVDVMPTLLDYLDIDPPVYAQGKNMRSVIEHGNSTNQEAVFITRTPFWESVLAIVPPEVDINKEELLDRLTAFDALSKETPIYDVAIRTPQWKLIWRKGRAYEEAYGWFRMLSQEKDPIQEYELYDMVADPDETTNVIALYPDIAKSLRRKLEEWDVSENNNAAPQDINGNVQPYF